MLLLSNSGAYPKADPEAVPEGPTWTVPALSGGDYGQAQLPHPLGLALWLTGLRGKDVFAFMSAPLTAPVELHDAIALRYDNIVGRWFSGAAASRRRAVRRRSPGSPFRVQHAH